MPKIQNQKKQISTWPERPRRRRDKNFDYRLEWIRSDGRVRVERYPRGSGRFISTMAVGGLFRTGRRPTGGIGVLLIGDFASLRRAQRACNRAIAERDRDRVGIGAPLPLDAVVSG